MVRALRYRPRISEKLTHNGELIFTIRFTTLFFFFCFTFVVCLFYESILFYQVDF